MKRKLISLLSCSFALCLALFLAGCSDQGDASDSGDQSQATEQTQSTDSSDNANNDSADQSGTSLDKQVTLQGLTVSVPSAWTEETTDPDEQSTVSYGSATYSNEDYTSGISIYYSDAIPSPEDYHANMESTMTSDPVNAQDWYFNDLGTQEISGATATKCEYGYTREENGETEKSDFKEAYIDTDGMDYIITVYGSVNLDEVLATIELSK